MPYGLAGMVRRSGRADCHRLTPGLSHPDATLSRRSRQPTTSPKASRRLFNSSHLVAARPEDDESHDTAEVAVRHERLLRVR